MAAKKSPTKVTSKTNSQKSRLLLGRSFNPRIAILIGVVLVGLVGFLFVRLSQAGSVLTWTPQDMDTIKGGEIVTKANGSRYVLAKPSAKSPVNLEVSVKSRVRYAGQYCLAGTSDNSQTKVGYDIGFGPSTPGVQGGGGGSAPAVRVYKGNGTGNFEFCTSEIGAQSAPDTYYYTGFTVTAPAGSYVNVTKIYQKTKSTVPPGFILGPAPKADDSSVPAAKK